MMTRGATERNFPRYVIVFNVLSSMLLCLYCYLLLLILYCFFCVDFYLEMLHKLRVV